MMGCNFRFHESIVAIKDLIDKKSIGKIISVQAESGSYLPDWHPNENYKKNYSAREDLGGGVVLTCIHEIDYLYWLFGDVQNIFSVTGQYGNLNITSEDLSAIIIQFQNDVVGELHLDYVQKPPIRKCKLIGTKGQIYWDSDLNIVKLFDFKKNRWIQKSKIKKYDRNTMYRKEMLHFIRCVEKRRKTINPIDEGIKTMEIALAVKNSSKLGRSIKI
jgi:predicted dehydrogenase